MFYRSPTEHQAQRLRRARPVIAMAGVAFAIGVIVGANHGASSAHQLAARFVLAWTRHDYAAMYRDIDAASKLRITVGEFADAYQKALTTAGARGLSVTGKPHDVAGLVGVPVRVRTRLFGTLGLDFELKVTGAGGEGARIAWSRSLTFPGLRPGELLGSRTALPRRATLLARDGTVLAESPEAGSAAPQAAGAERSSPLGEEASAVLGTVGPIPPARRRALEAEGIPASASVGVTGLERALDERLRGTPGGELLAGSRVLASAAAHPAPPVRSTVSPALQRAAVAALGGQLGGIVAMQPSTGQILAVAGIGLDSVQPPGSTFKMVTLTGVLQAGIAGPHTVFPYATYATLDGVKLNNANGEDCGGSLELAFAVSCNSVFAPLGVKLGAARLVAAAERFGFNRPPGIPGAAESTLPAAAQIQGELDVGSTAIGQGRVLASALEMATVAATIADGGRRPTPTFSPSAARAPGTAAASATVARTVRRLMIGVVRAGTGTSAAIPGVTVAGKTGTAELKTVCAPSASSGGEAASEEAGAEGCQGTASEASNTDAWFAAFAPALHPRIVVAVLLVKDGAGGDTAAPVARQVLQAGLAAGH
jgi:Penicillin binding protein transpeptidase domain/Penicillin-binding Protein dimerisation domain/NTF2-like N-terminal transpeptidase domain